MCYWSVLTVITMYVYCISGFQLLVQFLPRFSSLVFPLFNCVYCYGMCIHNAVFGLVCCIPLYWCGTTPASSTSFSINLTWKAACLCPFAGVLWRVLRVEHCMTATGRAQLTPLLQCKDSPFGPSAQIEHPWTTAVTSWEERPVDPAANWSVSSRTNSNKEILVTFLNLLFWLFFQLSG